jgi:hypothetical protein
MLEKAGFVGVEVKSYGTVVMLEDTVNRVRARRGLQPLPHLLFAVAAPAYAVFCRLTGRGDFISALARRPEQA